MGVFSNPPCAAMRCGLLYDDPWWWPRPPDIAHRTALWLVLARTS